MKVCCCVVRKNELIEIDSKKIVKTGIFAMTLVNETTALAASNIKPSVQPVIDVIVDLAEPISYAAMIKGALQLAIGNEHEGKKVIGNAFKGYLVVKVAPKVFDLIDDIVL